jgi:8-amino-7-oxononanoate synthase
MSLILKRIHKQLDFLHEENLIRTLSVPQGHDFCSNDYFGLSSHPHIIKAVHKALDAHGYGSTSSRFIRGQRAIYEHIEEAFAAFMKSERALIFSSGYAANSGVLSALINKGDIVFSDELNHASIIDGLRLSGAHVIIFPHNNYDFLAQKMAEYPLSQDKFLVTESLFSMDGDIAPLKSYAELCEQFNIALIVDEAHAVGIYGEHGAGLCDYFNINDHILCKTAGMGKAFGAFGAVVAGRHEAIELIIQKARSLIYSTALPPLALYALNASLEIINTDNTLRENLFKNIKLLHDNLNIISQEIPSPITPIIVKSNDKALCIAQNLKEAGFDIRAIRPPTVPLGTARLRITSHSNHSPALIKKLSMHLGSCKALS